MSYMKTLWTEIFLRYPFSYKKQVAIFKDYRKFISGEIKRPETKELREILKDIKKGKI